MTNYVFNTTIIPTSSEFLLVRMKKVSLENALEFVSHEFTSAIGHEGTAEFLSQLLKKKIKFNRLIVDLKPGDLVLAFKLGKRLEEGKILTYDELLEIPFDFYFISVSSYYTLSEDTIFHMLDEYKEINNNYYSKLFLM